MHHGTADLSNNLLAPGLSMEKLAFSWLMIIFFMLSLVMLVTLTSIAEKYVGAAPAGIELEVREKAEIVIILGILALVIFIAICLSGKLLSLIPKFLYWIFVQKASWIQERLQ
jgi:hypothetical protein